MSKEILDALNTQFAEMKNTNETVLAKKLDGLGVADLKAKADAIDVAMDVAETKMEAEKTAREALEAKTAGYEASIDELKAAFAKTGGVDEKSVEDLQAKAVELFVRKGESALNEDEMKALSTDSDVDGGFRLAATQTSLISNFMFETSPMRQYADVITTSAPDVTINVSNGGSISGWVGEKQARPQTGTAKFQQKKITPYELYAEPAVYQKMLDDADFNVEEWLSGEVSTEFVRKENTAFVNGSGVEQPRGFMTYPAGAISADDSLGKIEQISSGSATLITADALLDMESALKGEYVQGSNFFLNRTSVAAVRKLKDGQGNYLWAPGFDSKAQNTLMGYGYARFDDMPAQGAGALAVAFGNMKTAYQIVDRKGISITRDPYTSKPSVLFYTTKRVGGDVKNFEALKLMKVEA